jgi:proteasome accessory factor C
MGRVLAIIPWVVARDGATVAEIAEQFGTTAEVVERDLTLAMCCEAGPNLDHVAMWVDDDGRVHASPGAFFDRPRRLTPGQGVAVLAAVAALRQVPGGDGTALDSLASKLAAALGASGSGVSVVLNEPPFLALVREATDRGERLHLDYYGASNDEVTSRDVDPIRVVMFGDAWQLDGWCHRSNDYRQFRVDRIRAASLTGIPAEPHGDSGRVEAFVPAEHALRVVLDLTPEQRWAAERHAHEVLAEHPDGRVRIALWAAGTAWLERLLLRLGPDAVVVEPEYVVGLRCDAARRLLARYQDR